MLSQLRWYTGQWAGGRLPSSPCRLPSPLHSAWCGAVCQHPLGGDNTTGISQRGVFVTLPHSLTPWMPLSQIDQLNGLVKCHHEAAFHSFTYNCPDRHETLYAHSLESKENAFDLHLMEYYSPAAATASTEDALH